jgi:hypothetical protein
MPKARKQRPLVKILMLKVLDQPQLEQMRTQRAYPWQREIIHTPKDITLMPRPRVHTQKDILLLRLAVAHMQRAIKPMPQLRAPTLKEIRQKQMERDLMLRVVEVLPREPILMLRALILLLLVTISMPVVDLIQRIRQKQ